MGRGIVALPQSKILRRRALLMILVLFGTSKYEFVRPLIVLNDLAEMGLIKDRIIVQGSSTKFSSKHFKITPYFQPEELDRLIDEADLIIAHGGTGSVLPAVKKGKKVIAVARYGNLNEHSDNHQVELLDALSAKGYIIPWYIDTKIVDILKSIESFKPATYISTKHFILNFLNHYIKES
jgi:UDP-N-acetylglucosamine transferase subunit ALG13